MPGDAEVLPQSRRPDGSLRPQVRRRRASPGSELFHAATRRVRRLPVCVCMCDQVRVKKGYVPPEEQQKYKPEEVAEREAAAAAAGPPGVPGAGVHVPKPPMSKSAAKNAKRKSNKKAGEGGADASEELAAPPPAPAPAPRIDISDRVLPADPAIVSYSIGGEVMAPASAPPAPPPAPPAVAPKAAPPATAPKAKPQKERTPRAQPVPAPAPATDSKEVNELEKRLRNLRKKLKAIEELELKQAGGEALEPNQVSKIMAKHEILDEIKR